MSIRFFKELNYDLILFNKSNSVITFNIWKNLALDPKKVCHPCLIPYNGNLTQNTKFSNIKNDCEKIIGIMIL